MYSRNTSKNGRFSYKNPPVKQHRNNNFGENSTSDITNSRANIDNGSGGRADVTTPTPNPASPPASPQRQMPQAPPNYRGMIYEMQEMIEPAEGIDRLVKNDSSYNDFERGLRRRDYMQGGVNSERQVFSHMNREVCSCKEKDVAERDGIQRIIDNLREKKLLPEDILICALIILMLNSSSEDDILMILALMMLL